MREKFKKGETVTATRTFNGEIITGEFQGYHLFNDEIPDTVVGIVRVPGDGVYDVDMTSIRHHENKDERIRKELIQFCDDASKSKTRVVSAEKFLEWASWLEKQKKQKPIMDVFGFKVGDAVRLKDGDGRKHIIKSFEEVEGIHGPNFYHVEFEDNSARDGIYPGKEYPNGYYTQMEKFEEEQKPAWSEEDESIRKELIFFLKEEIPQCSIKEHADKLKEFVSYLEKQKDTSQEWEQEDEKMLDSVIRIITQFDDLAHEPTFAGPKWTHPYTKELVWLKALRPQPKRDCKDCAMFLNGKCTKPPLETQQGAEEQMMALKECGECKRCIKELYEDLKKRYGTC